MSSIYFTFLTLSLTLNTVFAGDIGISEPHEDKCRNIKSCAACLDKIYCTWCVTKSLCTRQACGNDNVIYHTSIKALMSGRQFCPRITEVKERVFKSGHKEAFIVEITQIYLYMAFTPWKCKVIVNGKEIIVNAVLLADKVYCDRAIELKNDSDNPYVIGSVSVMWNYNKYFDGSLPFKVCRADLDLNCT